jgi:PGF-pre-PGF domain-containing protein
VYQYVNIWVGDTGFAEPENIENAVVTFKVSKSWIENNSIADSSVSMYRYNGEWAGLPTRKVKEDNEYVYFEAKTPGFSPFAIIGTTRELAPAGESPLMSPGDNAESGTTVASASAVEISEPVKSGSWLWLLLALLLAICVGAYVGVRKGVISPGRKKFENVVLKEVQTMPVSAGTIVSYVYENEENPVRYVNFEAGKDLGDLEIKVEVLREKSRLVKDMPSGIVYRHINIWAGKSDFPGLTDIAEPVIGFQVDKSWIEEKGLDESDIRLLRYEDGVWQDMVTELADTDEGYLVFESKISGFGAFAISGIKNLSS